MARERYKSIVNFNNHCMALIVNKRTERDRLDGCDFHASIYMFVYLSIFIVVIDL